MQLVFVNDAGLHDEFHALEFGDVFERIAAHRDNVRPFVGLDGANFVTPAQQLGPDDTMAALRGVLCASSLSQLR